MTEDGPVLPPRFVSTMAIPINSPNEQGRVSSFPSWSNATHWCPIFPAGAGRRRGGLGGRAGGAPRARTWWSTKPERASALPALGGSMAGSTARGNAGGAAHRRRLETRLSQLPKSWWRSSSPATRSRSAPVVVAATAIHWRGRSSRFARDVRQRLRDGQNPRRSSMGVVLDPENLRG